MVYYDFGIYGLFYFIGKYFGAIYAAVSASCAAEIYLQMCKIALSVRFYCGQYNGCGVE